MFSKDSSFIFSSSGSCFTNWITKLKNCPLDLKSFLESSTIISLFLTSSTFSVSVFCVSEFSTKTAFCTC
ncbi:hypothetical protein MSGX11T_02334 [Mycoplasma synoviae GX11-T]|nr:hypothetical protein [Mycoplasmopsis synoviae GX11-T]